MKTLFLAIFLALISFNPAFAGKKKFLDFEEAGEQEARWEAGIKAVESHQPKTSVRIMASEYEFKKRSTIRIIVYNASGEPFTVGPENVSAFVLGGEPIEIISYEQLVNEEKKRQAWAAVAVGLQAFSNSMQASQAGRSTGTFNYSGTTYGAYGSYYSYGSGTYSSYDPGKAYAAQQLANFQNQQRFEQLAASNEAAWEALKVNIRTTTIDPETGFGGSLVFELPKSARKEKQPLDVRFIVKIAGEIHEFVGNLYRSK